MSRKNYDDLNCSIAQTLDLIGEWWTILILREAFFGTRRFEDFQFQLNIARNILTTRLQKLCDNEILKRVPIKEGAKRHEYKLTKKGHDLVVTLIALSQWGDRWIHQSGDVPIKFCDRATGEEISDITIRSNQGKKLLARDLVMLPGPGATSETRQRLEDMKIAWEHRNKNMN